jgi:pantetheine-phosphate adenylyltransferase
MTRTARLALCPGSFDPITIGHEDIIRRSLALADEVVVAVGHSPSEVKRHLFGVEERVALIREVFADEPRIFAADFEGLVVSYARERGAAVVVRGLRTAADFEYESRMARMNRELAPEVDTVFLAADPRHAFLSASLVREVWGLGGAVDRFVPPAVLRRLHEKRAEAR